MKEFEQYSGPLTVAEAAVGMAAARRNAIRLLEDARILYEAKRYASALALGVLSIEESGKDGILVLIAETENGDDVRGLWRKYRQHRSKTGVDDS